MRTGIRLFASGLALAAAGLLTTTLVAPAASAATLPPVADRAGDTLVNGDGKPIAAPRADVVTTTAEFLPEAITLGVKVQESADPLADANWGGEASYLSWSLDVNNDTRFDFEVKYLVNSGRLTGTVARVGAPGSPPPACDPPLARFTPEAGYGLSLSPKCLDNPSGLSYRVTVYYKVGKETATDMAPDKGPAGPLFLNPQSAAPAPAPAATPASPAPALATQAAPPPAAPRVSAKAPSPAAAPAAKPAPAKPAPTAAKPAPAAAKPAPAPNLARTGPRAELWLAGLGAVLMLAGFSLKALGARARLG
jgi:hypothetical protein